MPELIRDGETGVLVEADCAEALCDAVLKLLRDPQQRLGLAERARLAVGSSSLGAMAEAVGRVYRNVVARSE